MLSSWQSCHKHNLHGCRDACLKVLSCICVVCQSADRVITIAASVARSSKSERCRSGRHQQRTSVMITTITLCYRHALNFPDLILKEHRSIRLFSCLSTVAQGCKKTTSPTNLGVGGNALLHCVCHLLQAALLILKLRCISLTTLQGHVCSMQLTHSSPGCRHLLPALLRHLHHARFEVLQGLPLQRHTGNRQSLGSEYKDWPSAVPQCRALVATVQSLASAMPQCKASAWTK